ncbi:MAG: hypothetical protein IIA82_11070 [Thaumarchaeota archaeon]|nr:hypothetical protein [Nitrososphaerota archaeon]
MDSFPNTNSFSKKNISTNDKQDLLTLINQTNAKLTLHPNDTLSDSQMLFLDHMLSINQIEQRPVSRLDYSITQNNFRQKILEVKSYIVKEIGGRPPFYKVRGVELPGDQSRITIKPTGVDTSQLERLLLNCKNQPPMLHDIRFMMDSDLHEKLLNKRITPNKNNSCIVLTDELIPNPHPFVNFKLLAYPEHIQLIVGCSRKPLFYSTAGISDLVFTMGRYVELLRSFVDDAFSIPQVSRWRCKGYHFNKDGTLQISGQNFEYYFEDFQGCMIRIYTKHFSKNDTRLRVEKTVGVNKTIEEMTTEALA